MFLVAFAGQREDAPGVGLLAGLAENPGFVTGHGGGGGHHLVAVVHDAHGAVFREHHQIHAGQALFHADDHVGNLARVVEYLVAGVQARHLVVDDGDTDGIGTAGNISVTHG